MSWRLLYGILLTAIVLFLFLSGATYIHGQSFITHVHGHTCIVWERGIGSSISCNWGK